MHMAMVMRRGISPLAIFVLFGWLWGARAVGMALAAKGFGPTWLQVAAANMWVGVAHAGYAVQDEAPILLLGSLCQPVSGAGCHGNCRASRLQNGATAGTLPWLVP